MMTNTTRNMTRDYSNNIKTRNKTSSICAMQINLNDTKVAQDLLNQWMLENKIELAAVQEPYNTDNKDYWFTSTNGLAAIY